MEKIKKSSREPIRTSRTFSKDLFISILTGLSGDFLSKMRLNGIHTGIVIIKTNF